MATLGSLFDGSGGFPLAASLCGIKPVWASEIEPYPIAVTRSRFPKMKHLGDVSKVRGADIEPVDIVTFGSPCQDMSIAGKRAGLKHEDNGDDETTRSGLFMEAVRIIKEMREATNGEYPTFAVWENVPGAFSSNKGEDFRTVLEELIKIVEPTAVMPAVPKNGWPYADSYCGDGWSLAYRVFDAQYWGVPQRRRRIYLVADLRGQRAGEILFERDGVRGDFATCKTAGKGAAGDVADRTGADDCEGIGTNGEVDATLDASYYKGCGMRQGIEREVVVQPVAYSFDSLASNSMKSKNPHSGCRRVEIAKTLDTTDPNPCKNQGGIGIVCVKCYDARGNGDGQTVNTLTGDHENGITDYSSVVVEKNPVYCLQGNGIDRADTAGCNGKGWKEDVGYTLNTIDRPAVAYEKETQIRYIVRRLTPTECARLQGFPSVVEVDMTDITRDELAAIALSSGYIKVDVETGKVYGTRGPGGTERKNPIELYGSNVNGYIVHSIHAAGIKKQIRAHRLVWIAAHGAIPDGMIIDHINNDKSDNRICNLQLLTPEQNSTKAREDGRYQMGENHPKTKISEQGKRALYFLYWNTNKPYSYYARMFGISDSRAQQIIHERQWADTDPKEDFTDEEYRFWLDVRNTYAAVNGKPQKDYTKAQMLTWYNKLHTDSAEYKMWGNGIALPCALYCMQGIAGAIRWR